MRAGNRLNPESVVALFFVTHAGLQDRCCPKFYADALLSARETIVMMSSRPQSCLASRAATITMPQ